MTNAQLPTFDLNSYPKSFASLDSWRLHQYLHLDSRHQHQIYKQLERFCLHRAHSTPAIQVLEDYAHLGSGWEWSVFAKNEQLVIKVPAGIFPEVNTPEYLLNAQKAYKLLSQFYPDDMVAKTEFLRHQNMNTIIQTRLSGRDSININFDQADNWLRARLQQFFECTADLIQKTNWIPDFWLDEDPNGFILRNVMIDSATEQFAIVDFTSYLDPSRMYPVLCQKHIQTNTIRIQQMLQQLKS